MQMQDDFIDNNSYCKTFLNYMLLGNAKICCVLLMLPALPVAVATVPAMFACATPCILVGWSACGCPSDERDAGRGRRCNPGRICRNLRDTVGEDDFLWLALSVGGLWPIGLACMIWSLSIHLVLSPIHLCCGLKGTAKLRYKCYFLSELSIDNAEIMENCP